jgi:hypothetical protein
MDPQGVLTFYPEPWDSNSFFGWAAVLCRVCQTLGHIAFQVPPSAVAHAVLSACSSVLHRSILWLSVDASDCCSSGCVAQNAQATHSCSGRCWACCSTWCCPGGISMASQTSHGAVAHAVVPVPATDCNWGALSTSVE